MPGVVSPGILFPDLEKGCNVTLGKDAMQSAANED
jgi:hypothetical protein